MNYYISDLHLFHNNIIRLCNRPFKSVDEMNEIILNNYNSIVKNTDTVYFLGDVLFAKTKEDQLKAIDLFSKFKGNKILIIGNHDSNSLKFHNFRKLFSRIESYLEIYDNGKKVILFHYPIEEWNGFFRDTIHLYGHVHNNDNNLKKIKNRFNVSVDIHDFKPVTLKQLISK